MADESYHGTRWDERDMRLLIEYYEDGLDWTVIAARLRRKASACRTEMGKLRSVARLAYLADSVNLEYNRRKRRDR